MKKIIGLNTLRFLSFLAIFVYHTIPGFKFGYLGVDFFFVLSSFLITYLALVEIEKNGGFSAKNFFIRRALRIYPLYFFIVFGSFFVLPLIAQQFHFSLSLPEKKWMYFLFVSNYDQSNSLFAIKFLWSIAVEEQFYLLFILLSFFLSRYFGLIIALLFGLYIGFMVYADVNQLSTYSHTLCHFSNFAVGMLTAYLYFKNKIQIKTLLGVLLLTLVALVGLKQEIVFNLLLSILFAGLILLASKTPEAIQKLKLFNLTEFLGNYTYGLYVYSGFVITFFNVVYPLENLLVGFIIQLLCVFFIAFNSYHWLEKPFLSLKGKFR